jgi:uncharacterized secreted protein with C-terminal beta-propeller domain
MSSKIEVRFPLLGDSGSERSTTNTQAVGVDEADFFKHDVTDICIVGDTDFQIIRAGPAASAAGVSSTPIEGAPGKLRNSRSVPEKST